MTSLATQATKNGVDRAIPKPVEMPRSEAIELALCNGDLKGLSPAERWDVYVMRCEAAGLDPRSQPFRYIVIDGVLQLYATKGATDQLVGIHGLTVKILRRGFEKDTGCYTADAQVIFPSGRSNEDVGVVFIPESHAGKLLANAIMTAVTKAKRRTVLSACGLGMLDETEVDSIPDAQRVNSDGIPLAIEPPIGTRQAILHDANSEPKSAVVSECKAFVRNAIRDAEDKLRTILLLEGKGDKFEPLPNEYAVAQHLVGLWIDEGAVKEESVQKTNSKGKVVRDGAKVGATVNVKFSEAPAEFKAGVRKYLREEAAKFCKRLGVAIDDEEPPDDPDDDLPDDPEWDKSRE
jgi:hypothetical protein